MRTGRIRRRTFELVVVLVAVVAGASIAIARPSLSFGSSRPSAEDAVALARTHAGLLVNLSASNAADSLKKLGAQATGPWAGQLDADPAAIVSAMKKSAATTRGRVDRVAISSDTGRSATVLVAASSLVTNSAGAKNVSRAYYFVMTLRLVKDHWKVASMESAS